MMPPAVSPSAPCTIEAKPAHQATSVLQLGSQDCYWAILRDLPHKVNDYTLLAAFERWLPLPIEEVEARFLRIANDKLVIACGIEHATLRSMIEAPTDGDEPESIRPASAPGFITDVIKSDDIVDAFEFRRGAYTPRRVRRHRHRLWAVTAGGGLAACGFLLLGMLARASIFSQTVEAARLASDSMVEAVLGAPLGAAADLSPAQRLEAELRARSQSKALGVLAPVDVAPRYLELLLAWPAGLRAQVHQLAIDELSIRLEAHIESADDAEQLARTLDDHLRGWQVGSRNIRQGREGVRLTLALVPESSKVAVP